MGTWSVTDARAWARERLANAGIDSVDADVRELLEWACDASSQWDLPEDLNEEQAEKLRSAVGERALRIPLQHVTSRMFFRGLTLAARPGVFVVRPETEVLAGLAIDEAMSVVASRGEARVVDLCAGSGAIGLAVAVETTDEPFTREYSVESFGPDYLFRVRIRLGFKVSQSIPAYLHQIMHDLEKTGELPNQQSIYPKLDADPGIGTIRYVVIHKALMPESKVSGRGALSLQIKYAIRRVAGSPVKWFGLAPYNPLVEVQPLFVSTRRPPRLTRVASQAPKREG